MTVSTATIIEVPEGFKMNAKGNMVALCNISTLDSIEDEQVLMMIERAQKLQQTMLKFKNDMFDTFETFIDVVFDDYGVKRGGKKGNISLVSFDGTRKVQLAVSERMSFDARLQVALDLIHEYFNDLTKDSDESIKTIVMQAFKEDKQGNISATKLLSLRRMKLPDERWIKAMDIIADSLVVTDTKNYMRFFEREAPDAKWNAIPLDIAAL